MVEMKKDHFAGKTAREHLDEMQSKMALFSSEGHGVEARARTVSFLDAFRDTILVMGTLYFLLIVQPFSVMHLFFCLLSFGLCWSLWRGARAALYSWSHLERVHRLAYEERCEIDTNREQEREELKVLYGAKGFSGELLDRVVDVLMADRERLLSVMLEEEMGLQLKLVDHPLHNAASAFLGALGSLLLSLCVLFCVPTTVGWVLMSLLIGLVSMYLAHLEQNSKIKAFVWSTLASVAAFQAFFVLFELLKVRMAS